MFRKRSLAKRSREPFSLLRQMTSELGRMLDVLFARFRWPNAVEIRAPKVDVVTKDNTLITRVDWPGMTKDDVLVHVEDGQLVLSGERKKELQKDKDNVNREERDFDSFRGVVHLPKDMKVDDVKVTFANGVLEVTVTFSFMVRATSDGYTFAIPDAATSTKAAEEKKVEA
jgi:HSP20 family protein